MMLQPFFCRVWGGGGGGVGGCMWRCGGEWRRWWTWWSLEVSLVSGGASEEVDSGDHHLFHFQAHSFSGSAVSHTIDGPSL